MTPPPITDSVQSGSLLRGERQVLELIATGAALPDVLEALCRVIDEESGFRSFVYLLDRDAKRLTWAAGPSLPEAWREATQSFAATPTNGTCGAAVSGRRRVIVADVLSSPLFTQWRDAVRAGLDILMGATGLPNGSTVYLLGIPRVQDLRGVGLMKTGTTFETQWSTFSICRIATNGNTMNGESLATRLAGIAKRQRRYNEILRDEAAAYNSNANARNPGGIEVLADYVNEATPSSGTERFGESDINAADCFHPSLNGQNKIAIRSWASNPDNPLLAQ